MTKFKETYDFEARKHECFRIIEKYPDRIPVIVEKDPGCDIPSIDKKKFLVPSDLTMGQFIYVIRKRIKLSSDKAIYLFTDSGKLTPTSSFIKDIYHNEKDPDGFIYFSYTTQSTFG